MFSPLLLNVSIQVMNNHTFILIINNPIFADWKIKYDLFKTYLNILFFENKKKVCTLSDQQDVRLQFNYITNIEIIFV